MLSFLIYIIQASAWFAPLYILYLLLYKKFTFFSWNRYYLLLLAFASFVLPFVHFKYTTQEIILKNIVGNNLPSTTFSETITPTLNTILDTNTVIEQSSFEWWYILAAVYCIGAAYFALQFIAGLVGIQKLIKLSSKKWTDNLALVHTNDKVPHASFFHYIFLNNKTKSGNDREKIIYHEMQHNEKLHTIDVLFCELLRVVLWFNPLVHWYKKSLQEVHEYEVDAEMTKLYSEVAYAELLVNVATNQTVNPLTNPFSTKPLKTRLQMIFNPKTYPVKKLAFLLVLPVVAGLLMAYGNIQHKKIIIVKNNSKALTLVIDAGHGGADGGAQFENVKEKDLTLNLAKLLQQKAESAGYKVIMTRQTDSAVNVKDRAAITQHSEVGLFISLHMNSQEKGMDKNGVECYVGKNNNPVYATESVKAANNIMEQLAMLKGINVNQKNLNRETGVWVLKATNAPAVLLELGYLTNATDRSFITNNTNQQNVVNKIMDGVNNYYKAAN